MKRYLPNSLAVFVSLALFYGLTANIASVFSDSFEPAAVTVGDTSFRMNGQAALDIPAGTLRISVADSSLSIRAGSFSSVEQARRGAKTVSKCSRLAPAGTAAVFALFCRTAMSGRPSDFPVNLLLSKRFLLFRFLLI